MTDDPVTSWMPALAEAGNRISRRLDEVAAELRDFVTATRPGVPSKAAAAKANYERVRAERKIMARKEGAKTVAESDDIASADDQVQEAYEAWLTIEGTVEALRSEGRFLVQRLSWGQSLVAVERESDRQHAMSSPSWRDGR